MTRPALDIREDIEEIIRNYPPLRESRPYLTITVDHAGRVTLQGNVRTRIIRRVLTDSARLVSGVTEIDAETLHDDDGLVLELGRLIPPGIYLVAVNGDVVLSGRAPAPSVQEALIASVKAVPGVRSVKTRFYTPSPMAPRM